MLTIVIPIAHGREADVRDLLQDFNDPAKPVKPDIAKALDALGMVHFLSMSVIPASSSGPAHLFWEAAVDGEPADALQRLTGKLAPWLHAICKAAGVSDKDLRNLPAFLKRHTRALGSSWWQTGLRTNKLGLTFCGAPSVTAERIKQEEKLTERIADLKELGGPGSALQKLLTVRETLWAEGAWKWAFVAQQAPFLSPTRPRTTRFYVQLAAAAVPALLWPGFLPVLAVGLLTYALGHMLLLTFGLSGFSAAALLALPVLLLRHRERTDKPIDEAPVPARVARIMQNENHHAINLMVIVSPMKPGRFRRFTLRIAFWTIGNLVTHSGIPGFLGDIGVVHFLQWALLPDSNQLIFVSHYDGSWSSYLEDFVNLVPQGPSAIWSNCAGFPRTRFLFWDGATDGDRFRRFARRQQIAPALWYARYPDLTLERIRINAQIRRGLATAATETDAQSWLALFGAASPG